LQSLTHLAVNSRDIAAHAVQIVAESGFIGTCSIRQYDPVTGQRTLLASFDGRQTLQQNRALNSQQFPLTISGNIFGYLEVYPLADQAWTPAELLLLEACAEQLSMVLALAQLKVQNGKLEQYVEHLE
jgi:GAF domain-containing protein